MKRLLIVLLCLWHFMPAHAQKENNIWTFGAGEGLNFNSGTPYKITTAFYSGTSSYWMKFDGGTSLCDARGQLLFYTDGRKIWDRTNHLMPNGDSLFIPGSIWGGGSDYSVALSCAIPQGADTNLYYIFTMGYGWRTSGGFYYSVVDMRQHGGLGDILSGWKSIKIDNFYSDIMEVAKGEGCSYWLMTVQGTTILAYKVDVAGIHSPISSDPTSVISYDYSIDNLKIAPDRKHIAAITRRFSVAHITLFDFDPASGKVSNPLSIDTQAIYSYTDSTFLDINYSPDGSKLYVTSTIPGRELVQYNLSLLPDTNRIMAEKVRITDPLITVQPNNYYMRSGPDRKIYVASAKGISCIEYPNNLGNGCGFKSYKYSSSGVWAFGPNLPSRNDDDTFIAPRHDSTLCILLPTTFSGPEDYTSWIWNDGTTSRSHTFNSTGTYWVNSFSFCGNRVDTFKLSFVATTDSSVSVTDSAVCFGRPFQYLAPDGYNSYKWSDGDTGRNRVFPTPATLYVDCRNLCSVHTQQLNLHALPDDTIYHRFDTTVCFAGAAMVPAVPGYRAYVWQDGSTAPDHLFTDNSRQWVCASNQDCKGSRIDTIGVNFVNPPVQPNDGVVLCSGAEVLLSRGYPDSVHLSWQDGSHDTVFRTSVPGTYWVNVTAGQCTRTDTIQVHGWLGQPQLGPDTTLCEGSTLVLNPHAAATEYRWSDGSNRRLLYAYNSGTYWVTIADSGCVATDTINVDFLPCRHCITMPTAFTPNGDNRNDVFLPAQLCPILIYHISIFNRWGEEVYNSYDPTKGWDGTYKGIAQSTGTFYYMLWVLFDYYGAKEELVKGDVVLIR